MMIAYQGLPQLDMQDGFLRAWWFDPLVATCSFAFFINLYWYQERKRGLSTSDTFVDTCTLGFDSDGAPLFSSTAAYWIGILLWKLVIPPAAPVIPDGIPYSLSDLAYLVAETVAGVVLYDAIFFLVHWAMHEVPCLRKWHARHHNHHGSGTGTGGSTSGSTTTTGTGTTRTTTLESRDTLRHSLVDGSLQVLIHILVQRQNPWNYCSISSTIPKSRCARALHNIVVTSMLTESHTSSPVPNVWRRWCVGVREHRWHHLSGSACSGSGNTTSSVKHGGRDYAYGKHHRHQQFFGYLDDLRAWYWMEKQHCKSWRIVGVRVQKPSKKAA